jgi:hypothetical protein
MAVGFFCIIFPAHCLYILLQIRAWQAMLLLRIVSEGKIKVLKVVIEK